MAGNEAVKVLNGLWSEDGDRVDPEDSSLEVPINRRKGFTAVFSAPGGARATRRFWNQRFRELFGAAASRLTYGVEAWDADVDYPANSICSVGTDLFFSSSESGPSTGNAVKPGTVGQTKWGRLPGRVNAPSVSSRPTAEASNGILDVYWNCPLDGGADLTGFQVRWRVVGQSTWQGPVDAPNTHYRLTGLTNGAEHEFQVRVRNAKGWARWSATGKATPQALIPDAIDSLVAVSGEHTTIPMRWQFPPDNGSQVIQFIVQWRAATESYDTARQASTPLTEYLVEGLTNGTVHWVRVRARNGVGLSPWSSERSATPQEEPPPPPEPSAESVPGKPGTGTSELIENSILWSWPLPQDGRQRIAQFEIELTVDSVATTVTSTSSCHLQRNVVTGKTYQARARARNGLGLGEWSDAISRTL